MLEAIPYFRLGEAMPDVVVRLLGFVPALKPVIPDPGARFQLVHSEDVARAFVAGVRGVGDAFLFGSLEYSMRVWVETDRLTSLGITPNDIISALQSQNIQAAVGRIGAQPMTDDQLFQLNIQTKGRLTTAEEFGNTVVRANPDGSFVRIRDIGRV